MMRKCNSVVIHHEEGLNSSNDFLYFTFVRQVVGNILDNDLVSK